MPDALPIEAARYECDDIYPVLVLTIAGREARILAEVKPSIYAAGLVRLGEEFADLVPDRVVQPGDGGPARLVGFTDDGRAFGLFDRFLDACAGDSFAPGPVCITTRE